MKKPFAKILQTTYGGAVAIKGTDLLAHARNVDALTGDVSGLAMLGVGGLAMEKVAGMAFKKRK